LLAGAASESARTRETGEPVVFCFFGCFEPGEICGDPGRLRFRLNSASSVRLPLDFPFPFAGLGLGSSDKLPLSEPTYGDSDLPASEETLDLTFERLAARRVPVPIPMQELR